MKTPSVSLLLAVSVLLLLCGLTVSAVSVSVRPNRQQFFSGDSVSLSCVGDGQTVDGWTVKRTREGLTEKCGVPHDKWMTVGSSCILSHLVQSDSGHYWCDDGGGQRSGQIDITVSGGPLIVEIPALPVPTGSDVTVRCKNREDSEQKAAFFKNSVLIGSGPKGEFTLTDVQQSDDGFYSCSTVYGTTPQSRLRVRGQDTSLLVPVTTPLFSVKRLFCHLVVFCPYCICTALLVSICCSRRTGNKPPISMEMTPAVGEYDDVTADVTTEHDLGAMR